MVLVIRDEIGFVQLRVLREVLVVEKACLDEIALHFECGWRVLV